MFSKRLSAIACIIFLLSPIGSAAQPEPDEINSPNANRAFRAALRLLSENPERRTDFLRPGFSMADINKDVVTQFLDKNGQPFQTRYNTDKNSLLDLGTSLNWMKDTKNMRAVYKLLFPRVPREFTRGLLKPGALRGRKRPVIKRSLLKLFRRVDLNFGTIIDLLNPGGAGSNTNPIGVCSSEVGYEVEGSESELSERCELASYDPDGLFTNIEFPLKDKLTCIKAQGSRGTCVAHAIAATAETLALLDGDPAENLAEQHIYYRGETEGDSQVSIADMQIYGLYTDITLDAFNQQNLGIFYENGWNYNRSLGMGAATVTAQATINYPNSCDANYTGEVCDDYAWQTDASVPLIAIPQPDPPPGGGAVVHHIISDSFLPCDGVGGVVTVSTLQTAIILVAGDVPVILSMAVTDAFQNTTDGYVLDSANDPVRGGHAMELIGFVPNSDVPAGAPQATAEGYFIVKNSWGVNNGDCGFYYLDYAYVRDHVYYVSVIDIN